MYTCSTRVHIFICRKRCLDTRPLNNFNFKEHFIFASCCVYSVYIHSCCVLHYVSSTCTSLGKVPGTILCDLCALCSSQLFPHRRQKKPWPQSTPRGVHTCSILPPSVPRASTHFVLLSLHLCDNGVHSRVPFGQPGSKSTVPSWIE